ncbi:winged helix-turn-helix domain-containing protein [Ancylobacter terrae]|uniref:winged helix-turn-helix domain-containing protein n=1 Tax=Ancylobacter sp. sgz301288 TaxID=3342077 RepID=UPI00385DC296
MGVGLRFGALTFDPDFLAATRPDGGEVRFTRSERALLLAFTRTPGRVMTRNQLLDAVAGIGSDSSDRNIDFVINRLRAKLGDNARAPRFIATRYGEGYLWIADPHAEAPAASEAFLRIGPCYGLARLAGLAEPRDFLARLRAGLARALPAENVVELREQGTEPAARARFVLELSFYRNGAEIACAAVLREGGGGRLLSASRLDLARDVAGPADALAGSVQSALWRHLSFARERHAAPTDVPMELRLHDAARLLTRQPESWLETEAQTARAFAERPDDPEAALALGMSLYSRLLFSPYAPHSEPAETAVAEDEIERLVLMSLPRIDDDPILTLAAAKLLLFVGRGYHELAGQLAEHALAHSTAFAPAFSTLGQVRMCEGQIAAALELYEHGIELAEPGSQFHVYLMTLACVAHLAAGDRPALDRACARLYAVHPLAEAQFGSFATPLNEAGSPVIAQVIGGLDARRAHAALRYSYYVSARMFLQEEHRENLLRDLLALLGGRFGWEVVPDEVWRSVPRLHPGLASA